jgi:hypothetical protein
MLRLMPAQMRHIRTRQHALSIALACTALLPACAAHSATTPQLPSWLSEHLTDRYTRAYDSRVTPEGRYAIDRFRALGPVDLEEYEGPECWLFVLSNGPHCFEFDPDPPTPHELQPQPRTALRLVAQALGDSADVLLPDIVVSSLMRARDLTCVTFWRRGIDIASSEMRNDDAYGKRDFGTGFVCERPEATTWFWENSEVDYYGEQFYEIWDVFLEGEDVYIVFDVSSCASECAYLVVHRFVNGRSPFVGWLHLWNL